ncbi:MAG: hypothetical protein KC733_06970 [Candidatus Omnitrophica bacterium]|nr:hypothetical protein [Candidatus Omnitrophota bacterium]
MTQKFLSIIFLLAAFTSGCASTKNTIKTEIPNQSQTQIVMPQPDSSPQLQNLEDNQNQTKEELGVVFAKTDFRGSLAKHYVKLIIENKDNPQQRYQLHIGDKSGQIQFPWEVKEVEPGYFFIELPKGNYKFSSISIPVGSGLATEELNILFSVDSAKIYYLGTLRLTGTKETLRLGGVPLIRPGFDYTVEVNDDYDQGLQEFYSRYPNKHLEIEKMLMQVHGST